MESVWDLPLDLDPEQAAETVETLWESEDTKHVAFDIACGLYWHCADWHGGQSSVRYSILCSLGYNPGACERGPDGEASQYVYDLLEGNS